MNPWSTVGIGCPRCSLDMEVSEEDPDATLSEMHRHLQWSHSDDPLPTNRLLVLIRTW